MKLKSSHIELLVKLVAAEAKKNPSMDVDLLLMELNKAAEFRSRHYKPGQKHGPAKGQSEFSMKQAAKKAKEAQKKREEARPQLGKTSYHPLLRHLQ